MKKLAIILDSFSGHGKKFVLEQGIHFVPLRLFIDGKEIVDDGTISNDKLTKMLLDSKECKTSQPNMVELEATFKKLASEYDQVIFLPAGSGLSGTFQTASVMTKNYDNITVFDTHVVNSGYFQLAKGIKKLFAEGKDMKEISTFVKNFNNKTHVYIIPKDLEAFRKGGRIGAKSQYILSLAKIIPILEYTDKVRAKTVRRSMTKAADKAIQKMLDKIGGLKEKDNYVFSIVNKSDESSMEVGRKAFQKNGITKYQEEYTAGITMVHTGVGAIALICYPKLK